MFDERSGILESGFDKKSLCYFELDDVNVEQPVDFKDLVAVFSSAEGMRIRYQVEIIRPSPLFSLNITLNSATSLLRTIAKLQ